MLSVNENQSNWQLSSLVQNNRQKTQHVPIAIVGAVERFGTLMRSEFYIHISNLLLNPI